MDIDDAPARLAKGNAAVITHCLNRHDELVHALELAIHLLENADDDVTGVINANGIVTASLKKTLERAKDHDGVLREIKVGTLSGASREPAR